jgi:hypothetical protein
MDKKVPEPQVKESAEYENLLGEKSTDNTPSSLLDLMDLTEDEKLAVDADEKEWKKYWKGMPEFNQEENKPFKTIYVHFRTEEDYEEFAKLISQKLTKKTKSIWHPKLEITKNSLMRWIEEE